MINHKKDFKTVIVILSLLFLSSCARTVSTKSTILDLEVIITTSDPVDFSNSNLYIVFSKNDTVNLPEIGTSLNEYMPTPGTSFGSSILNDEISPRNTLSHYYTSYFSSWNNYILIGQSSNSLYLTNENGFSLSDTENETDSHNSFNPDSGFNPNITLNNKTIALSFTHASLSDYFTQNSTVYIAIFIVQKTLSDSSDNAGRIQDRVILNDPIRLRSNEEIRETNLEGNIENNNFDISNVTIKVF